LYLLSDQIILKVDDCLVSIDIVWVCNCGNTLISSFFPIKLAPGHVAVICTYLPRRSSSTDKYVNIIHLALSFGLHCSKSDKYYYYYYYPIK
jgi:hypothetical protein